MVGLACLCCLCALISVLGILDGPNILCERCLDMFRHLRFTFDILDMAETTLRLMVAQSACGTPSRM